MSVSDGELNPLLPSILQLLREAGTGISEYELLKKLEGDVANFFAEFNGEADLVLFQKHFLLMNALYRLQQQLWRDEKIWLTITPLRIVLEISAELASSQAVSAEVHTALRDYYLDWQQLRGTGSADVAALLNGFWRRFHSVDRRVEALRVLQLEASVAWPQIQLQYRRLAAATHPDRGGDVTRFLAIREAYETLRMALHAH